jgi:hypothetical protein
MSGATPITSMGGSSIAGETGCAAARVASRSTTHAHAAPDLPILASRFFCWEGFDHGPAPNAMIS